MARAGVEKTKAEAGADGEKLIMPMLLWPSSFDPERAVSPAHQFCAFPLGECVLCTTKLRFVCLQCTARKVLMTRSYCTTVQNARLWHEVLVLLHAN